jgi:hypothetical protein
MFAGGVPEGSYEDAWEVGQPEERSLPAAVWLAEESGLLSVARGAGGRRPPGGGAASRGAWPPRLPALVQAAGVARPPVAVAGSRSAERPRGDSTARTWPAAARRDRGRRRHEENVASGGAKRTWLAAARRERRRRWQPHELGKEGGMGSLVGKEVGVGFG